MLPSFPDFKKIELTDRQEVLQLTSQFPPYSDFNFTSMWSWDIQNDMGLSTLNGNLVVKFNDYITKDPFFSFIGNQKLDETATTLLRYAQKANALPILKLIPEEIATQLDHKRFILKEERDHFDYIYDIQDIVNFEGSKYKKQRREVSNLKKKHDPKMKILDLTTPKVKNELIQLTHLWMEQKFDKQARGGFNDELLDFMNEYMAFRKLLNSPQGLLKNILCIGVYVNRGLSAFILDEKISDRYCISHFGKFNRDHSGTFHFLTQMSASNFLDLGVNYYNIEQDLGLEHLRISKSSYNIHHFLKKYYVSLRSKDN